MIDTPNSSLPQWTGTFLDALRAGANLRDAALAAGVAATTPYHWRRKSAEFREAWIAAAPAPGAPREGWGGPRCSGASKLDRFIAALGETSNITAAAEAGQISVSQVYKLRREDPAFARRWFDALAEGYDNLEMELLQHLRGGQGADEEGAVAAKAPGRKFDVATAFRCLAAHRDNVAKEKGRRTLADEVATIAAIDAKIDRLRLNQQASDKAIRAARRSIAARSRGGPKAGADRKGGNGS